jgi:hypothetical protein
LWRGPSARRAGNRAGAWAANFLRTRLLKGVKSFTAREANKILGLTGKPFWQAETYDHYVCNKGEWDRIASYIEDNPLKAGIVSTPEDCPWSSAHAPA